MVVRTSYVSDISQYGQDLVISPKRNLEAFDV